MARSRIRAFLMKPMLWSYESILVPILISKILKHPLLWRFVGISSSTIGLLCYALSSSFQHLYGKWNFLKTILYCGVSLIISCIMLFPEKLQFSRSFQLKSHVVFLVLILTSLYSVFYDKAVNGKPDVLSLISNGAFALMSLSLSRQIQPGFESGLCNFFLGCFVVQLIKFNFILTSVVTVFCYSLIALRSCMHSKLNIGHLNEDDQLAIEIGTINEASFDNLASTEMVHIGSTSGASFDNLESIEMISMQKEARGANKLRRRSIVKAEQTSSSRIFQPKKVGGWTEEEHKLFLMGLDKYGKGEWKRISREFVKSRTPTEVANHALKDFIKTANANRRRRKGNQILNQTQNSGERVLQLRFLNKLPTSISTLNKLTADSGGPIQIALLDAKSEYTLVKNGPLSSLRIEICALNGEFGSNSMDDDWTADEFNSNLLVGKDNKGPLLGGDKIITLENGVAYIPKIMFMDDSSWIRCGKFRIGAKIAQSNSDEVNIKEAVSDPFVVEDNCEQVVESIGPAKEEKKGESKKEVPKEEEPKEEKLRKDERKMKEEPKTEEPKKEETKEEKPKKEELMQDESKMEEGPKKEEPKKDPHDISDLVKAYEEYYCQMRPQSYYVTSVEENPNPCVIC